MGWMISGFVEKSISVFLPAYNEEGCIKDTVLEVDQYLKNRFKDYEILVMSHGSTDNTNSIVRELMNKIT